MKKLGYTYWGFFSSRRFETPFTYVLNMIYFVIIWYFSTTSIWRTFEEFNLSETLEKYNNENSQHSALRIEKNIAKNHTSSYWSHSDFNSTQLHNTFIFQYNVENLEVNLWILHFWFVLDRTVNLWSNKSCFKKSLRFTTFC